LGDVENQWLSTGGSADTENIGDLGKLKEALTLKRGILTEMPDIGGRDFYPLLAKVGKDVIEGEGTLGFEASLASMTS
jgi:hypothetical protein